MPPVTVEIGTANLMFDTRPDEAQERGTGVHLWDSSRVLANYIMDNKRKLKVVGSHVLELGAGCGLGGLGAAVAGAKSVVLTDIEAMCPIIARNVGMNDFLSRDCKILTQPYLWADPIEDLCNTTRKLINEPENGLPCWDMVIGADVVFTVPMIKPLLDALLLLTTPQTKIIIVFEKRCHITFDQFFVDAKEFFVVKEQKIVDSPNPYVHLFTLKRRSQPLSLIGDAIEADE
eukprot:GDKJ01050152.1.p1 GENE.GDKJ01050152.1~~GDKJ01050152.1.p1  ORF type:complete len:232 (-),score=22.37 GDKJ01050152.1:109-804(-)